VIDRPQYNGIRQNQLGIYAAANYAHKAFNIEGGARFNHHSEYGSNYAGNINPSVFIKKRVKVFANASTGYKTPSLYQLFSVYGNQDLEPETSVNLEAGVQYYTKDQNSSVRLVYFNRHISDAIAFFFDPVTFESRYINQDEQKDYGFELEAGTTLARIIQIKAIYSYVNGEITTKQNGKDTSFFNLLRRPKSTINYFIGAQLTRQLYLSLQANCVGERKDVYFNPNTFAAEDITLKSYVLVNFYAEYGFSKNRLKLFADIRNIFDEQYSDIYGYNTPGINAYGGIRFRF
jgi:vitamin B12 transporter